MKRIALIAALALTLISNVYAATVVTSPDTNAVWYPGDKVTITWDSKAFPKDATITVSVTDGKVNGYGVPIGYHSYIYYYGPNTGQVDWVVPAMALDAVACEIVVNSNASYSPQYSSGYFQIRFGHTRPGAPVMKAEQAVYLTWNATYGNVYEVQSSTDLQTWVSEGYTVADTENFGVTLIAKGMNRSYRIRDLGPWWLNF